MEDWRGTEALTKPGRVSCAGGSSTLKLAGLTTSVERGLEPLAHWPLRAAVAAACALEPFFDDEAAADAPGRSGKSSGRVEGAADLPHTAPPTPPRPWGGDEADGAGADGGTGGGGAEGGAEGAAHPMGPRAFPRPPPPALPPMALPPAAPLALPEAAALRPPAAAAADGAGGYVPPAPCTGLDTPLSSTARVACNARRTALSGTHSTNASNSAAD